MPHGRTVKEASAARRRLLQFAAAAVVTVVLVVLAMQSLVSRSTSLEGVEHGAHSAPLVRDSVDVEPNTDDVRVADAGARARASALETPAIGLGASGPSVASIERVTLVGRVVDVDGHPLQAVVVVAEGDAYRVPIELDEIVEQFDELETERTRTDDDGRFRFGPELDLAHGAELYVGAVGHVPLRLDRLPHDASTNEAGTVDCGALCLARGISASGRVVDRAGNGVPGAEVRLAIVSGEQTFEMDVKGRAPLVATSGVDGGFTLDGLAPGPFTLLFDAPGYVTARASRIAAQGAPTSLQIVLEPGARLVGRIVGREPTTGDSYGALRVELRPGADSDEPVLDPRARYQRLRSASVGADGAFEVAGLLPDMAHTLIVTTELPNGRSRRVPEVAALTLAPATRMVDVPWRTLGSATLRVVDGTTGAPIEHFGVSWCATVANAARDVRPKWHRPQDDDGERLVHHPDGRLRLDGLAAPGALVSVEIELGAPGYDLHSFTVPTFAVDLATDLGEARLKRRPEVRVNVRRVLDGTPVANATVYMVHAEDESLTWWIESDRRPLFEDVSRGVTNAEGTVLLPSLPGTRVAVGAKVPRGLFAAPVELVLSSTGGEELTLLVVEGATLVVQVVDPTGAPAQEVTVSCRRASEHTEDLEELNDHTTDRAGMVRIEGLAADIYEVAAAPWNPWEALAWRRVVLESGRTEEVRLAVAASASLIGRVSEGLAPLAGARVVLQVAAAQNADKGDENDDWGGYELCEYVSKADGTFVLGPVALGELDLVVHHADRTMPVSTRVTLRAGVNRVDVALPVTSLEGRLVDHDEQPWVEAWVQLLDSSAPGHHYTHVPGLSESPTGELEVVGRESDSGNTFTDTEGRFRFVGIDAGRALTLYALGDDMEPLELEISPLADGDRRDLGALVRDVFGELVVTLATPPTAPFELKLFDAESNTELVGHRVSVDVGDGLPAWSLARGRYRVELHDTTRPGEPRSAEAIVEPRAQTTLRLP
jgi:hypothetical protein